MNVLGHSYIAVRVIPKANKDLLIIGSLLPESFPFIERNPFGFEEIHEGGERLLGFLERSYPKKRDLALGILVHSKEFGADGSNKGIESYAGSRRKKLLEEIAECSGVELRIAEYRLHNFLWWGVDVWILREHPEFVGEVQEAIKRVDIEGTSSLLAKGFDKEPVATKKVVTTLFREVYQPADLVSVEGLARTWARQAAGLPEKDRVDVIKTARIFEECTALLKNNWRKIVGMVETEVAENLRPFIETKGVKGKTIS